MHVTTYLNLWSWHHKQSHKATQSLKYEKNADRRQDLERARDRHAATANGHADTVAKIIGRAQ